MSSTPEGGVAAELLTPEAVRSRCRELFDIGLAGRLPHFRLELDNLDGVVDRVLREIDANYPGRRIPLHSRWRHFEIAGQDLWAVWADSASAMTSDERARARFDLAIVSVLLDAGAGADWSYVDPQSERSYARSEGLALASFDWLRSGRLSGERGCAMRADAEALCAVSTDDLASVFQVTAENPLAGLEARAGLLNRLGHVMLDAPDVFGAPGSCRPGHLYDHLSEQAGGSALPAREILIAVLRYLGAIWPHGMRLGDVPIGDVGRHTSLRRDGPGNGLVPFHKLSQWLSYSLIEPLREAGVAIVDLDALTGLAEYRNGGLFLDAGVLALKQPAEARHPQDIDGELVVEWRALTVALLDELTGRLRRRLNLDREALPLAAVLQGGSWSAGRRIAREKRPGGEPPITLASDGTVF